MRTDDEGHLILRYVGTRPGEEDAAQKEDTANIDLSAMVQDRLRADIVFDEESVDPAWKASTEARIRDWASKEAQGFAAVEVECRATTCRIVLEHADRLNVSEDRALMGTVQHSIQALIDDDPGAFQRVFMIAAYEQESEAPYLKVFLHRAPSAKRPAGPSGG